MSGPNRQSNGNPQSCMGALFFYLLVLFVGIVAIAKLTGH